MKVTLLLLAIVICVVAADLTPREKALNLLNQMTLDEKAAMVHGYKGPYVGNVAPNSRLNIPAINLEDGPQGVADGINQVTCWPSSLAIAASWNEENVFSWASAMAKEQKAKGTNVMLGPDINIARVPLGGRIFEMFGEDTYLTTRLVVPSVVGIQSQGIVATAKHYIDNDQEYQRTHVSVEVDERTNWELYYPQFQAAVDAGVGAIMCSYNKINGTYACEQPQTLSDLKDGMNFQGWVMSDWGATHSTVAAANAGLDMEMPSEDFFGSNLTQAISNNQVPLARLDDMVTRILTALYAVGAMDYNNTGNLNVNVTSEAHNQLARYLSESAITLLQNNDNILPLSAAGKTFAILGDAGSINPTIAGGGSGHVNAPYTVTPLQGITNKVGSAGKVTYAPSNPVSDAAEVAASADVAIVFVGFYSSEGSDRANLSLPYPQDDLVSAVAAANPNTIVVLNGPGPVLMPWANSVKGIVFGFFPGQESGNAIANVLFGDVNPSAKLPVSFPVNENDWFSGDLNEYPGVNLTMLWYDQQKIKPLFPFGHGLSYSTFVYSDLQVIGDINNGLYITLNVENASPVDGSEVVQLYIAYPSSAGEPPKVLRGFQRLTIPANTNLEALFVLTPEDISIWDISSRSYTPVTGTFGVLVGASSQDIRLTGSFDSQ